MPLKKEKPPKWVVAARAWRNRPQGFDKNRQLKTQTAGAALGFGVETGAGAVAGASAVFAGLLALVLTAAFFRFR